MKQITVQTIVKADVKKTWEYWTKPEHIMKWNYASDDWHCPSAMNDVRVGGKFCATMASKDGKFSFDFEGTYATIKLHELIEYEMTDGRKVKIEFKKVVDGTQVIEIFDPENENSIEMQRDGWQAILNNFKKYIEQIK